MNPQPTESYQPPRVPEEPERPGPTTWFHAQENSTTAGDSGSAAPSGGGVDLHGGRFTILRPHAQGGLGQISLARDEQLNRVVALKEIRHDRQEQHGLRQRFLSEAEITGQLEHPGVVPIYALQQDAQGRPYYAMRFIQGRTLAEAIGKMHAFGGDKPRRSSEFSSLAFRELLQRFLSVCQTIGYAHSKGVIHRDLKPANVMLGDYGETLVLDWGLAKRVAERENVEELKNDSAATDAPTPPQTLTQAGQVLGTPAYMAPEQAAGDEVGAAADIYALGVLLYEILVGRPPYHGPNAAGVLLQVQAGNAPVAWAVNAAAPRPLSAIAAKAMARNPAERYALATELAMEVERWLADQPVAAYREPWQVRAGRWLRRHRTLVIGSAIGLTVAAVALAVLAVVLNVKNNDLAESTLRERTARERSEDVLTQATQILDGDRRKTYRNAGEAYKQLADDGSARQQFAENLLGHYEGLAKLEPDNPSHQSNIAFVQAVIGIKLVQADEHSPRGREFIRNSIQQLEALSEQEHRFQYTLSVVLENTAMFANVPAEERRNYLARACRLREARISRSDAKPDDLSRLASVYLNFVAQGARHRDEELEYLRKAKAVCLRVDPIQHLDAARLLVAANVQLADHLLQTEPEAARAHYTEACEFAERLAQAQPDTEIARVCLAAAYEGRARGLPPAEAATWQGKACAQDEARLLANRRLSPLIEDARRDLVHRYYNLGLSQGQAWRTIEARQSFERVLQHGEDLLTLWPQDRTLQYEVAIAHWNVSRMKSPFGLTPDAFTHAEKAARYLTEVVAAAPENTTTRGELLAMLEALAQYLAKSGRRDPALVKYREAAVHLRVLCSSQPGNTAHTEKLKTLLAAIIRLELEQGNSARPEEQELLELGGKPPS